MVDADTIDYLLTAAIQYQMYDYEWAYAMRIDAQHATLIGTKLLKENAKSIRARYSDSTKAPAYEFKSVRVMVNPIQVLKTAKCFEYQACEHDGWHNSKANRFVGRLKDEAIGRLNGYEEAQWGYTRPRNR